VKKGFRFWGERDRKRKISIPKRKASAEGANGAVKKGESKNGKKGAKGVERGGTLMGHLTTSGEGEGQTRTTKRNSEEARGLEKIAKQTTDIRERSKRT